jgi:ABC-type lipoprotein export system ATPase subunit
LPSAHIVVESKVEPTGRVRQLEAMFDVPPAEKTKLEWDVNLPLEEKEWHIGMIVGPSGSGKSTILSQLFGDTLSFTWQHQSVLDDFAESLSMSDIATACSAVGFNTIPAWMRPHSVLSTEEKFRVEIARRILESDSQSTILVDEFTSVVDRQVAQICSFAVQKWVRKNNRQLVVATCHYDIEDWLQPDWIYDPSTGEFYWRLLRRRPPVVTEIGRCNYETWRIFAPFHYLTPELNRAARCYALTANGNLASFAGILYRPHPRVVDIVGVSRVVTLPDYQGLGLAMVLLDNLGAAYKSIGFRLHNYPAHPSFIRSHMNSVNWRMVKNAGDFSPRRGTTSTVGGFGGRPCGVFCYIGPEMSSSQEARKFIDGVA